MRVGEFLKVPYKEDIEFIMVNYCDNYKTISFTKDELKCEKYLKKDVQALKIKEVSYIHCEAFASGELKHGTIALITQETPVIALLTQENLMSKQVSNIREVQSRGARVISFVRRSLKTGYVDCSFELPDIEDDFTAIPAVVSLQLLAYYVSSDKGLDVDKPRNLAKVVTVE